jgi:hypothetical protein
VQKRRLRIKKSMLQFGTRRRQLIALIASSFIIVSFVGYRLAGGQETKDAYQFSRAAQQGKAIVPVPLNLAGKNPEIVYIGSYLVNAQLGCNSCHTCPSFKGTDPFKVGGPGLGVPPNPGPINTVNYLAGGVPFPGRGVPFQGSVLAASNLTPDSSGLPGGLTYDDFKSAMQNGSVTKKSGHVLQVMPWPVYRNLYEDDLNAIYQYLSAIPQAQPGTCANPGQAGG